MTVVISAPFSPCC